MRQLVLAAGVAAGIAVASAGCVHLPNWVAQDGVNDEQGGSVPGIHPCDGPGN